MKHILFNANIMNKLFKKLITTAKNTLWWSFTESIWNAYYNTVMSFNQYNKIGLFTSYPIIIVLSTIGIVPIYLTITALFIIAMTIAATIILFISLFELGLKREN